MPTAARTPSWHKEHGYQNPSDAKHGVLQTTFACEGKELFPWLQLPGNEALFDSAQSYFEGDRGSRPSWVQWFPVREKLLGGTLNTETPLLVDVAGGRGHDLMEFHEAFKTENGWLVLQDTQPVLDSVTSLGRRSKRSPWTFSRKRQREERASIFSSSSCTTSRTLTAYESSLTLSRP